MLVRRYSSRMRILPLALALLAAPVLPAFAQASAPAARPAPASGAARWADSVRVLLDRAVIRGERSEIVAARSVAERALQAFPDDALLLHYQGVALWRESQLPDTRGDREARDASRALLERAIGVLQRSQASRPMAETQAVISSAYGMLAGGGMTAAMRNGPSANAAEDAALELGPTNARVLLLSAISSFHKPAAFGGGKDKARATLARALAAFESDAPAAPLPSWGRAEAYAWLGQLEADAGNKAAARAAYQRALELEPDYTWVRRVLLPALDRER